MFLRFVENASSSPTRPKLYLIQTNTLFHNGIKQNTVVFYEHIYLQKSNDAKSIKEKL